MRATSSETLEYELLRDLLARYTSSALGLLELAKVQPNTDLPALETAHAETAEAIDFLRSAAQPKPRQGGTAIRINFSGLPDLNDAVHKLRIEGASLDPKELYDVIALLDRASDAKSILHAVSDRYPRLNSHALTIGDFKDLLRAIEGKVLPDGSVADTASVALNRIRREIERQKRNIHDSLERFLRAHRDEGILQEEIVTIRNERFVVPVIAGNAAKLTA